MLTGHAPNPGTLDPHAQAMVVCVLQHLIDTKAEPSPALGFAMAQLPPEALPLCCTFLGEASPRFVELVPVCVGRVLKWPLTADVGESHVLTTRQRVTVGRSYSRWHGLCASPQGRGCRAWSRASVRRTSTAGSRWVCGRHSQTVRDS